VFATAALTPETWRRVRFDASGLVPAIVQESETGQVLMLAYMNREALTETLHTGRAVFYSRSRQALWRKGDTSGQVQWVQELFFDCDMDAVLVRVKQVGVACHTGRYSCFWQRITSSGQTEEALPVLIDPEELYHHPGLQDTKRQP
jgi:phosphoribosyl-AMP cyclohydrolase